MHIVIFLGNQTQAMPKSKNIKYTSDLAMKGLI
jgi:hypothetical protein